MSEPRNFDLDAYSPAQMALLAETAGVAKARLALPPLFVLAVLAGAFIAFGALFYAVTVTGSTLGDGPTRLLGGIAFSLGLVLVVIAGAELFTGNNLIVMAWAHGQVGSRALLRNWGVVYVGNLVGGVATALAVLLSGIATGPLADTVIAIAEAKAALPALEAFFRGVLCNALVCLAVWLCFAARDVSGKILAILFPTSAFIAIGFEHSVANMFLMPLGFMLAGTDPIWPTLVNLVPVTLGNIVGGGGLVALTYWFCYLRG